MQPASRTRWRSPADCRKPCPPPDGLPSQIARGQRPDVAAGRGQPCCQRCRSCRSRTRPYFPRLTLSGVIGLLAFDPADFFDEDFDRRHLTAGIAGPLLDFGRVGAGNRCRCRRTSAPPLPPNRGAVFSRRWATPKPVMALLPQPDNEARLAVKDTRPKTAACRQPC